jgi:hypothetical protein
MLDNRFHKSGKYRFANSCRLLFDRIVETEAALRVGRLVEPQFSLADCILIFLGHGLRSLMLDNRFHKSGKYRFANSCRL